MADQPRIVRQDGTVAASENPQHHGFSREDFTGGVTPSDSQQSVHPTAERLSGPIMPAALKDYKGPLFVINKTSTIISHDDGKGNVLRVEPKHDKGKGYISVLPVEVANGPRFQKLWRTGRIVVTTDPAVEDELTLVDTPEDMGGILPYTLDAGQNKDLSPMDCLICEDQIFLSKEDIDSGTPALCEIHVDSHQMVEQVRNAAGSLVWKLKDSVVKKGIND